MIHIDIMFLYKKLHGDYPKNISNDIAMDGTT